MTKIEISLPDELARRARSAGLLSDAAMRELLEDAIRRQAGRRLLNLTRELHDLRIPALSTEAVIGEVKAVRADRRARQPKVRAQDQS